MCLLFLTAQQLLRSDKFSFSLHKCSAADWTTVGIFCGAMIVIVYFACKISGYEQGLKKKYNNVNLVPSDLVFEGKVLINVLILGFGGGWVAGALGLGGGVIYNPLLLSMGVPPKVSSATGMYLITFSKIATCLIYYLSGELLIDYAIWVAFWSCVGAIIGLMGTNWYMRKFGRQSIIVLALTFMLAVSTVGIPYFGFKDVINEANAGEDVLAFHSLCD